MARPAFVATLIVSFVDSFGAAFLASVSVVYGLVLKDDNFLVALSNGLFGFTLLVANIWMSRLADRAGERCVLCVALAGKMVAYALQALSWEFRGEGGVGFWVFFAGRGFEGLFAGTGAVFMSLLMRWYSEPADLKKKIAIFQAFGSLAGMFLPPLAGLVMSVSMPMPFCLTTAVYLLGLIFAAFALPRNGACRVSQTADAEVQVNVEAPRDNQKTKAQVNVEDEAPRDNQKSKFYDKVLVLATVSAFGFGVATMGMTFLLNLLILRSPSFGVVSPSDTDVEQKVAVARIVTLILMPLGLLTTFGAVVLYPKLTTSWGDSVSIFVFGSIISAALLLEGLTTALWQVFACSALLGLGLGILTPALGPLLALYAGALYPNQVSETIAMPQVGMALGLMVGSNVVQGIDVLFETGGERIGFIFIAVVCFLSTAGMSLVGRWVERVVAKAPGCLLSTGEGTSASEIPTPLPSKLVSKAVDTVSARVKENMKHLQARPSGLLSSVPDAAPSSSDAALGGEYHVLAGGEQ